MTESIWQKESTSPGRLYMLGHEPYVKYDDQAEIVKKIQEEITKFLNIQPAIRLTLDGELTNSERAILAIPFDSDNDQMLENLAQALHQSLMGYYISAEPKTSHFGITNLIVEGNFNSLLKRETEKLLTQIQERTDIAGRLIQKAELSGKKEVPTPGEIYLAETIKKGLDIHIGYRVFMAGADINYKSIFIPLPTGGEIIERVYYNLEQILQHNFVTYDETNERYLKISETLVFKELEEILKRAKSKEFTRNKVLNNLQYNTIQKAIAEGETESAKVGDNLYDFLNNIQDTKLVEATNRSRDLFTAYIKETTNTFIDFVEKKAIGEEGDQVESDKPEAPEAPRMTREQIMNGQATAGRSGRQSRQPRRARSTRETVRVSSQPASTQIPSPPDERLRVPQPEKDRNKEPVPSR